MARNLVNVESVNKAFDIKQLLVGVSLGVAEGERIGIVGRNGAGKSTLMKIIAGIEQPDSGRVTKNNSVKLGMLNQVDVADKAATVRDVVLGDKAKHEWASDAGVREVFTGLFGGFDDHLFERTFLSLSGGERRRVGLAKLLIDDLDLILLDEPTNHLDVEGVAWLAEHLNARKDLAVLVVTHDRWFLDAVTDRTWEVVLGKVEEYDGGYSAFVLAKAERARQANAMDARRNNLIRKELAWLRRGAPARTTKPKFRVDAANVLIAEEPAPRDQGEPALDALLAAAEIYRNTPGGEVHAAHIDMHLAVQALASGQSDMVLDLTARALPVAERSENAAFMASLGFIRAEALGFQGRTAEAELTALANDLGWQVITHPFDGPLARTLDLPDAPFYVLPDLLIRGAMPAPVLRRYLTARDGD